MADGDVCGTCRKFDLRGGQRERSAGRDAALILFGVKPPTIGRCKQNSDRITTTKSPACDHYAKQWESK